MFQGRQQEGGTFSREVKLGGVLPKLERDKQYLSFLHHCQSISPVQVLQEEGKMKHSETQSILHCQETASICLNITCSLSSAVSGARYLLGSLFLITSNLTYLSVSLPWDLSLSQLNPGQVQNMLWGFVVFSVEHWHHTKWMEHLQWNKSNLLWFYDWSHASGLQLKHIWKYEEGASPKA